MTGGKGLAGLRPELADARLLTVKTGSSLLIDNGRLNEAWLAGLAADLADIAKAGSKLIIVTSGAVSLGAAALGLPRSGLSLADSQAAAAAGQIELMRGWQAALAPHGLQTAQVLLTAEDTEQRRRYLNARQTLTALLDLGVVPVINENDTVATQELRYGDNDRLAARVAAMISADALLLLSDIDGLYAANPAHDAEAAFFDRVETVTPEIEAMAGDSGTQHGSGGMVTKLQAAKIAQAAGCHMVLAGGRGDRPLSALAAGARSTLFPAQANPLTARKNWIAGTLQPAGTLHLDDGAAAALGRGKSLLPVGVTAVDGAFERGDCVALVDAGGQELGRGLAAYASDEARRMMGRDSQTAAEAGHQGRPELVHRDDMVLNGESPERAKP